MNDRREIRPEPRNEMSPPLDEEIFSQARNHHQSGRLSEAESLYRRLVTINPAHVGALYYLAALSAGRGDHAATEEWLLRLVRLAPNHAETHYNLGAAAEAQGNLEAAIAGYQRALALKPDYVEAHFNSARVRRAQRRYDEAEAILRRILALNQSHPEAHNFLSLLGMVLEDMGQNAEALASFRQAIALKPDLVQAHNRGGKILIEQGQHAEAIASFRRALAINPNYTAAHSNIIFTLNLISNAGPEEQQQEREQWYEQHGRKFTDAITRHQNIPDENRRLRIGYVGAHFRYQAAIYAFGQVVTEHDRAQFDVYCYSDTVREDDLTERFKRCGVHWRQIVGLSDDKVADMIRSDAIDILVDPVGHMAGNRLLVFARKPAPLQVTGWGEPTGTGLKTMDYLLADPVLVPIAQRHLLSEQVIDLPCFLGYWAPDNLPAPRPLPAMANRYVTFGSFNRLAKTSDAVLRCWSAIVRSLPNARLMLKDKSLNDPHQRARISAVVLQEGISAERLTLYGSTDRVSHFLTYGMVDIALDPFPHSGGMTTLDALYMGVPVITCPGRTISSRLATSILTVLGLERFIAADINNYVDLATATASDLTALAQLRNELRGRINESQIGDPVRYTRSVEAAYRTIWRQWCQKHCHATQAADFS